MRSVPSRTSRYGFTPEGGDLNERIRTLRGLSTLGRTIGERPLPKDWEKGIQSYADAVWGTVRVLQDAAAAQRKVTNWANVTTDTPANAAPYEAAIKAILDIYNPASKKVQDTIQKGQKGAGWVTWKDILALGNQVLYAASGINWTDSKGDSVGFSKAQGAKDALRAHLGPSSILAQQRKDLNTKYQGRSLKVDESYKDAIARFVEEDAPAAAAPAAAAPAATDAPAATEAPASTALAQVTTESAPAPGAAAPTSAPGATAPGAAPGAMPAWFLPAVAVAGAAGVALLLLPSGSSNRGSRARNLDYGSVPSDAQEGRMIRGTLRNLESDAHAMRQMLRDDDDLPQWIHSKVETSADRVNGAQRYLRAKIQASK